MKTRLEFQERLLEKKANKEEFTAASLVNEEKDSIKAQTVEEFYLHLIAELKEKGQVGTSYAYLSSYRMLKNFNRSKSLNFTFSHIDANYCRRFEEWLSNKGDKDTTISYQLRTLRAAFNRAIDAKVVSREKNPFAEYKLSHLNTKTMKRALSKSDILRIIRHDCTDSKPIRQLAQDLFAFSYLCGGISFVDIANLTPRNIIDNRLMYQRQKTHGGINLPLSPEAQRLIAKYADYQQGADYLFPILHCERHITPMQKTNRVRKVCHAVNGELRALGKELGISTDVTTYVARHSFATVLKKSGVNIGIISQALGHQDIKTTQIYLDSFDNEQIDEVIKCELHLNAYIIACYMALSYNEETQTFGYKLYDEAEEEEQEQGGYFALIAPIPIEYKKTHLPKIKYQIKAIKQREEVTYDLIHGGKGVFYVDTPYGRFHFELKSTPLKYIGNILPQDVILKYLEPLDMCLQEEVCLQHQFFFVGD